MKKAIVGIIFGIGAVTAIVALICVMGIASNFIEKQEPSNAKYEESNLVLETDSIGEDDYEIIATNASELSEEEQIEVVEEMVDEIPEEQIEEFEDMSISELKDDLDDLESEYEVGEPFSEEDQNKLLYAYETYGPEVLAEVNNDEAISVGWTWKSYNIGNTTTKCGVKIGYSGKLKTYSPAEGGTYCTDVDVTVYSGKNNLKSAKWKTRHTAYGLLGVDVGYKTASTSLGIVYDGSVSSSKYAKSFSFNKTKQYSGLWAIYLKTWGVLDVKTKNGEFNMQTTTKTGWE